MLNIPAWKANIPLWEQKKWVFFFFQDSPPPHLEPDIYGFGKCSARSPFYATRLPFPPLLFTALELHQSHFKHWGSDGSLPGARVFLEQLLHTSCSAPTPHFAALAFGLCAPNGFLNNSSH